METEKIRKLLIVDDNPRNIQVVGNMLHKNSMQISYATDAAKALELAKNTYFDLFLLDIMMPGVDGFELCELLRNDSRYKNVPIIFLTAKTDSESIVKGFQLGANDYVTKPFNGTELLARVETHLDLYVKSKQLSEFTKELEAQVKTRTQELAAANEMLVKLENTKGDFLALMGHELRNPLNSVIGLTTLLSGTNLATEQREYLLALSNAAMRLNRFSELTMLVTTLRSNEHTPALYPMLLKYTLDVAIDNIKPAINNKSIQLATHFENPNIHLLADSTMILKCMDLILENAVVHSPKGGTVSIEVFEKEDGYHCVSIKDQGAGFDTNLIKRFNEYKVGEGMMVQGGVGLSLIAVKIIMELNHGSIIISNSDEGGAMVCLLFKVEK